MIGKQKHTITLETYKKSKKSVLFWFESTQELKKLGFSEKEIKRAILQAGETAESLTSFIDVEIGKHQYYENSENYELVVEQITGYFEEQIEKRSEQSNRCEIFTRNYQASANKYRFRGHYQGTKHAPILRNLLNNKFPYLKKYKIELFPLYSEGINWEIYLKINKKSLYVPVKALIKKDSKIIIKRMLDYWDSYRSSRNPKIKTHNHKKDQHQSFNGGCPFCQETFYQEEIKPLRSIITKRFFRDLEK